MQCPTCSGEMYDETKSKFWNGGVTDKGKQKPLWKCKDKTCGGAIWPEKKSGGRAPTLTAPVSPRVNQVAKEPSAWDNGFPEPPDDVALPEFVEPEKASGTAADVQGERFVALVRLHRRCYKEAAHTATSLSGASSDEAISALCAQLFIESCKRGIVL